MEQVACLTAPPVALAEDGAGGIVLATREGLAKCAPQGGLLWAYRGTVQGAARSPDGAWYWTDGRRIMRWVVGAADEPTDLTRAFAGSVRGRGRVTCTGVGETWVEGCTSRRLPNGRFESNAPAAAAPWAPAACETDIYGNCWALVPGSGGQQALVLPANAPQEWLITGLEAGAWDFLVTDSVGYVWVAGAGGWRRFCPRLAETGWERLVDGMPAAPVTALGYSPDGLVMAAFEDGAVCELDARRGGGTAVRPLGSVPSPGRCLLSDGAGAVWVATDTELCRREPDTEAWQRAWGLQRGRLPGGGNHDIFAAACGGRLWVTGGWAGQWGLPVRDHVPDALLAFDPATECWEAVSRMYMPRRYNGIAALDERVWVVGGEARFGDRPGPHQALYLVDIYDPQSDSWSAGPSLNHVRTDPFVVTCRGRIYAIGGAGHNGGPKLQTVESTGPGEDAWRLETPLPEPTRQGHGCALGSIVYCFSIDGAFAFDTETGCWDDHFPQPGPIGQGPLAAAFEGEVWLMGGFGDRSTRCYNPCTRTWRVGPDLPTEQAWAAAVVLNDRLYVCGGAHRSEPHDAIVFDDRTYALRPEAGRARRN